MKEMKTLTINENKYEIVDANSRDRLDVVEVKLDSMETGEIGVGRTTVEGGEIFNDYESNKALSEYSKASGYNTLAGIKGYYYSSINFESEQPIITLTKEQGSEPTEEFDVVYEIGDVITLNNSSNYLNCATITAINKNKIFVDKLPFTEMKSISNLKPWHYSFYVLSKPTVGNCLFGYASTAEGELTRAVGEHSHVEGYKTIVMGKMSHAEGEETQALGGDSHAEGWATTASGSISHAEGSQTKATGSVSHAEGQLSEATGSVSHAEGHNTKASGHYSHTENWETQALGKYSHAEGANTVAEGEASHAEGVHSKVLVVEGDSHSGHAAHAEGYNTVASGAYGAHAEGCQTQALGESSHAGGKGTIAKGAFQTVVGRYNNERNSNTLFIVGNGGDVTSRSNAFEVHYDGSATVLSEGTSNNSVVRKIDLNTAIDAHNTQITNKLVGTRSSDDGEIFNDYTNNKAWRLSHAEGKSCEAMGWIAHAEGRETIAKGYYSHSEGYDTEANGTASHAEGQHSIAEGDYSHAEGYNTKASGTQSHAAGQCTEASASNQFVVGIANEVDDNALFIVGNGTTAWGSDDKKYAKTKSTAFKVLKDGSAQLQKMGTTADSVVTKQYVDSRITFGTAVPDDSVGNVGDIFILITE